MESKCAPSRVSAAPAFPGRAGLTGCSTSAAVMDLPAGQTNLVAPSTAPLFVSLGVGVQNYTCNPTTLTYASAGAVASIFDISCMSTTPAFANIQTVAFNAWAAAPAGALPVSVGGKDHYFITAASGTGLSPKWDFAASTGAFITAARANNIAAPTEPTKNVDWLVLNKVDGTLASQVFRIDTVGGQPPSSCTAGSADISVKYTSKYFLY
ncbi:hypothetical protein C8R43DRAFT_1097646 [Mycena crocata]|nr:hypothetical protein C8R43DRAFT_1097646 [Mycena crocata]